MGLVAKLLEMAGKHLDSAEASSNFEDLKKEFAQVS